ncbi:MAG: hypothetical protein ACD_21C00209G0005 [uncultured bacterium]|nr:MAG: hypothetical protein ACD_21C00209G0005 [uncultured bacterium]
MLNQDLSRFAMLITGIGEVYGKSFTSVAIDIYWSVLKAFKFEEVQAAFYRHLKNPDVGRFLPKPADVVMAIDGTSQNQALQAWTKVDSAIQRFGSYSSVVFDDALIHAVIEDMGGWQKLCLASTKQLLFDSKEFQERYRGYVIQKPVRYPKYFIGIIESKNSSGGYIFSPPVLIGDREKAKQVVATGSYVFLGTELLFPKNTAKAIARD